MSKHSVKCTIGGKDKYVMYSCPQGMTDDDLRFLFGDETSYRMFKAWMTGQTMSICDGKQYHHNRIHNEGCMTPSKFFPDEPAHDGTETEYTWRCGYNGGYEEPTECADHPHGFITYTHDVIRYLMGLPVID